MTTENKDQSYPKIFSRGTLSYYILVVLILAALLLGVFDIRRTPVTKKVIGTYGDYKVTAIKQGENVWEITVRAKQTGSSDKFIPIENPQTILWISQQEFKIKNHHFLEEKGKITAIIVTVEE